jgi:hypothetical protein
MIEALNAMEAIVAPVVNRRFFDGKSFSRKLTLQRCFVAAA